MTIGGGAAGGERSGGVTRGFNFEAQQTGEHFG